MKKDTVVEVQKISEHRNVMSELDIGHLIHGTLVSDVVVGEALKVYRDKVNNVERPGLFITTEILDIEEEDNKARITTQNSTYEVISLSPSDESNSNVIKI